MAPRALARVEMSTGSRHKYRVYRNSGQLVHSRVIKKRERGGGGPCPYNYGYLVDHFGPDDGKEIDAFVVMEDDKDNIVPGALVPVKLLAMFVAHDAKEKGRRPDKSVIEDVKVVALPTSDPEWDEIETLSDLEQRVPALEETLRRYIADYKGYRIEVGGWQEIDEDKWIQVKPSEYSPEPPGSGTQTEEDLALNPELHGPGPDYDAVVKRQSSR